MSANTQKSEMAALKPCPFCGGRGELFRETASRVVVWCEACRSRGPAAWNGGPHPSETELEEAKAAAITAWNTRPTLDAAEQRASSEVKVKGLTEALVAARTWVEATKGQDANRDAALALIDRALQKGVANE